MNMIFDSHAHLIADDHDRYPPTPLSGKLRPGDLDDPITAERLLRLMDEQGVERALVVQRAHVYGYDSSYVTDSATKYPDRFGAVVAIDAQDEAAVATIQHWVKERGAVGIRLAAAKMEAAETAWLTVEIATPVWQQAAALNIPICVHVFRSQRSVILPIVLELLRKFPLVPVVIDHLSNMATEQQAPDFGFDAILAGIAACPNALIKISTINLARLAEQSIDPALVLFRVIQSFGADRLMWGSDIGQSKGNYGSMVDLARQALANLDLEARGRVLNSTAAATYR
jgi:L-fuconolactonase